MRAGRRTIRTGRRTYEDGARRGERIKASMCGWKGVSWRYEMVLTERERREKRMRMHTYPCPCTARAAICARSCVVVCVRCRCRGEILLERACTFRSIPWRRAILIFFLFGCFCVLQCIIFNINWAHTHRTCTYISSHNGPSPRLDPALVMPRPLPPCQSSGSPSHGLGGIPPHAPGGVHPRGTSTAAVTAMGPPC